MASGAGWYLPVLSIWGGNGMAAEDVTAEIHGFSEPDSTPTPEK